MGLLYIVDGFLSSWRALTFLRHAAGGRVVYLHALALAHICILGLTARPYNTRPDAAGCVRSSSGLTIQRCVPVQRF